MLVILFGSFLAVLSVTLMAVETVRSIDSSCAGCRAYVTKDQKWCAKCFPASAQQTSR